MTADNVASKHDDNPELIALRQRLIDSGVLGRSAVYINLLDYLLQCSRDGRQPKEFEIAVDVLNRDSSFDVARDSVVRVYIHQLRKRLDTYFDTVEPDASVRFHIPKGQYTVVAIANTPHVINHAVDAVVVRRPYLLYALVATLLLVNLWQWFNKSPIKDDIANTLEHPMWAAMQDDDIPVLIVMGDYYIFGELDDSGRVSRMVRDFMINSRQDLVNLFMQDASLQDYFRDLDMTYMPEGSASALLQIAPLVKAMGKRVNVTMMSRLSTSDLRSNHIIYIGYISAMDKLNNLYFAASGLIPGRSFDEIYNKETGVYYTSNAGLPEQGQPFRDLALVASWPAANGNQFVLLSGTRDAGLMHAALVAGEAERLMALDAKGTTQGHSFEALYEVYGIDRMNFDANLLYQRAINPDQIWARE
ncbi:MAG: hypothetical protein Q7W55_09420 [Pseudohongiella sp.]|nr:hypothetical protein [Pseudohongiella sp.]MDO9522084.1 hypothetical protein [Pseudohongiella sp.]MDP2129142.1 hypothetical protein [Pseudohongiella sp.]